MEWTGEGIILSVQDYGETSAILKIFTRDEGCYTGLVRGAKGKRMRPIVQIGNQVFVNWKARLSEHLGNFTLELNMPYAALRMNNPLQLSVLIAACQLLSCLPERNHYPRIYDMLLTLLDHVEMEHWQKIFIYYEMVLLEDMGFGLDLSICAATGSDKNLTHVSPRSGRAVSAQAAEPYLDKLLPLPNFLKNNKLAIDKECLYDAFTLTGYFLQNRLYRSLGMDIPKAREQMLNLLFRDLEKTNLSILKS